MDEIFPVIVILEDDAGLRRAIERLLKLSGFSARAFGSAEEPDLLACATLAACLVLDVQLPGNSGPAFYLSVPPPRPPVVFITAFDGPATRNRLASVGPHVLINKPFLGKDLLAAVNAALRRQP
ncbi:response regulator [Caballeronia sp. S22]|uniref:response regulator n=1 Tax=Caballeronia sp. S22 TaxID=3137182 RepID=UPI003530E14C